MQSTTALASETVAARAALLGTARERAVIAVRALTALLKNPDDTSQVFVLGLVTGRITLPHLLTRIAFSDEGARLLRDRPTIDSQHVDYAMLRGLPNGTLGREYVRFLDEHKLDPDLFQPPPGLPEIPSYIAQRLRQTHDIWHVLTGYYPDVPGEVALQAFTFAQTHAALSFLIAVSGALRWSLSHPQILARTIDGYRRGKRAKFLPVLRLEEMWSLPLEEVRRSLGIEAVTN